MKQKAWRALHAEELREKNRAWSKSDRGRAWRDAHRVELRTKQREYAARPEVKERHRLRRLKEGEKLRQQIRDWRLRNIEHIKAKERFRKYGISVEQFDLILAEQGFACAGCRLPFVNSGGIAVDHDHETWEIRGLLHISCNSALGLAKDSPETLRNLALYLESEHTGLYKKKAA